MLKHQHEYFCQAFIESKNATKSAVEAGYSKSSARAYGSKLMKRQDIKLRIAELTAEFEISSHQTVDDVIKELDENRKKAREADNPYAMNQATISKAKILGLDKPIDLGIGTLSTKEMLRNYDKQHAVIIAMRNE